MMHAPRPGGEELFFPLGTNACFGCGPDHSGELRVAGASDVLTIGEGRFCPDRTRVVG